MLLHARVMAGDGDATLARDNAKRRREELETTRDHRLRQLEHMGVVRAGRVARIATALVAPPPAAGGGAGMQTDYEVEQIAMDVATAYEEQRGWSVTDISKRMDGSGFDLRSVGPPGPRGVRPVRRIEVKGRAFDSGAVHLTPNEWRQARRLHDTYWLYVVWGCRSEKPRLKIIHDPWTRLRAEVQEVVGVKAYHLSGKALEAADGTEWIG